MTAKTETPDLIGKETAHLNGLQHLGLFILFLFSEVVIFILCSYYFEAFPTNKNLPFNLMVSAAFLIVTLWFKFDKRLNKHWQIPLVFSRRRSPIHSQRSSMA